MNPLDRDLIAALKRWKASPANMVRQLFGVEPYAWQVPVLEQFPSNPRIALVACKGPGKTTVLAWLIWNFMLTRKNPNIACISVDSNNLSANLWKELALWRGKSPLLQKLFEQTKTSIFSKEPGKDQYWFCEARSWKQKGNAQEQASSLAGLHAKNIMFVIDESGSMPEAILASAEAALSNCDEGHIVQAGNPERTEGPLYRASRSPNKWLVINITGDPDDPNRAASVDIEWARQQIAEWGRESDFVKINVLGQWPSMSANALISEDEVDMAMKRGYHERDLIGMARVMGVDVAQSETGDASVIARRQGLQMYEFIKRRGLNSNQGAALVAREWDSWQADAAFVDATGGYGSGWIDQLSNLGKAAIPVLFNAVGSVHRPDGFKNKRAEMAWDFVQWIKKGGALPPSVELKQALTRTYYYHDKDKLFIEPKEMVKAKIGFSPDEFDACWTGETLVATPTGDRPIKELVPGDMVLTPFGVSEIRRTSVRYVETMVTAEFSGGRILNGTAEHEIFAFSHGKVRLDAATLTMEFSSVRERWQWLILSALFFGTRSIGFKRLAATIPLASQSSVSAFCIAASGRKIRGLFRRARSFITRMTTGATVKSAIWNSSHPASTPAITWPSISPAPALGRKTDGTWKAFSRLPQNGTDQKMAASGIGYMESRLPSPESPRLSIAPTAGPLSTARTWMSKGADIAQSLASRRWPTSGIARTLASALSAASHSWHSATGRPSVVLRRAQTANVPPTAVYNLELFRDNAYYANGILVFNCILTHAEPVTASRNRGVGQRQVSAVQRYDAFAEMHRISEQVPRGAVSSYDPFADFGRG